MDASGETSLESRLIALVTESSITMRALRAARALRLDSWCIGAGAIRNLVWDHLHAFETTTPDDIDLVFHDHRNLSQDWERSLERALLLAEPDLNWEVVNQAAVHHWFRSRYAQEVQPFQSLEEGIASWPEVATCVGVTLTERERIEVISPHGLTDLFEMVIRWNPKHVSRAIYRERIAKKRFAERWPRVRVLPC